jgi:protoheme IX farnesyltransferase
MTTLTASPNRIAQYWALTKPRVTQLAVFCAVIGMFLATPELPSWKIVVAATIGIWLLAGAAFAINCLVEREIDSRMARTARRPMARGEITVLQTLVFSGVIGGAGMWVLYNFVNPLTMWLTFATFVGYAVIYTIILKPATPQNIVIGGLSGAMPPALGWAAVANDLPMQAWILVLIMFISGRWPCIAAMNTRSPACRCCLSRTAPPSPNSISGSTPSPWSRPPCCRLRSA